MGLKDAIRNKLSPGQLKQFRSIKDSLMVLQGAMQGIKIRRKDGRYAIARGGRTAIVGSIEDVREIWQHGCDFDFLFEQSHFPCNGNSILDFDSLPFAGHAVISTSPSSVYENYIFEGYLKHYAPKDGDVVLDCGAYHGLFAMYLSKLVGKNGKIYCFEPEKKSLEKLKANIARNGFANIEIIPKGVWNCQGKVKFFSDGNGASTVFGKEAQNTEVDMVSIDDFVLERGLRRLDFIKMDVEGAELEALEGCRRTMSKLHPEFAIASYHMRNGQQTCGEVERLLRAEKYSAATGYPLHLTTYGKKGW